MAAKGLISKQQKQANALRKNIEWIIEVRSTINTKEIMLHLKSDFGTIVAKRTVQRHIKEIRLTRLKENAKTETAKRQQEKKERTELKVAHKAEKKNQFPYFVTSPCIHKARIKLTSNLIQSGGCGNCGCEYNRVKGIWFDRFTGQKWGEKSTRSTIAGIGRFGWFDDSDPSGAKESSKRRGFF